MVAWRHWLPDGATKSMEPVLRGASLAARGRASWLTVGCSKLATAADDHAERECNSADQKCALEVAAGPAGDRQFSHWCRVDGAHVVVSLPAGRMMESRIVPRRPILLGNPCSKVSREGKRAVSRVSTSRVHVSYLALGRARVVMLEPGSIQACRAPAMTSSFELWRDNRGRLSVLRIATLALLLWPIGLAIVAWQSEIRFAARPLNDLIHRAGFWMLMFLLLSLAVTPLRRIAALRPVGRRAPHDRGRRLLLRARASLALRRPTRCSTSSRSPARSCCGSISPSASPPCSGLAVLAATSTDGMTRRLGGLRWRRLHQLVYLHRRIGAVPFLPADQARRERADPGDGIVHLADGLSAASPGAGSGRGELPTWCCWG